jgi:putative CocE/NonD family hydrolase
VASSSTALMLAAQNKMGVAFETPPLKEDTEVTGPLMLNLWVSSSTEDMDIMVTLRNIDAEGKDVSEVGQQGQSVPAVTKGWLRASHRKLDPARSLPYRPFHAHNERQWLSPGEIVECQIEIWPTCMVFKKGHKIRIDIQSRDGAGSQMYGHYHADYNLGAENTIYSGGDKPSYLLLPVIPAK